MHELFVALRDEHDHAWQLTNSISGPGASHPDARERRRVARELVALLSAHEFSEELVIWPEVRRSCPDGAELAAVASTQEHDLKLALNELSSITPSPEFDECVSAIAAQLRAHLNYEQSQVWPRLEDSLPDARLAEMRSSWRRVRSGAATNPHPHVPADPRWLGVAMPFLTAADRLSRTLRDRLSAAGV